MCLLRITETYDPPIEVEGWKAFERYGTNGVLRPVYFQSRHEGGLKEGEWVQAVKEPTLGYHSALDPDYEPGFHAFTTRQDAEDFAYVHVDFGVPEIRKVRLRGVHTKGDNHVRGSREADCYVGREMFILPKEADDVPAAR